MTNPASKTVLVTGAGGGFGREMVRQFRAAGSRLVLADVSDAALADAVSDAADALVVSIAADLADPQGPEALAAACAGHDVVPDILVNNAGVAVAGRLDNVPPDRWEMLMQLNLMAPMRLTRLFLPGMVERGSGHIVNIASIAGWFGSRSLSAYCASKFGLRGFGEALSADLEGTGVRVTNVYPCFSRTAILDSPQYGYEQRLVVPDYLVSEPADVVARVIDGIRRDRLQVMPDRYARLMSRLTRFLPWLVPVLDRRLFNAAVDGSRVDR
jgi:short-subunit dehydrogenase